MNAILKGDGYKSGAFAHKNKVCDFEINKLTDAQYIDIVRGGCSMVKLYPFAYEEGATLQSLKERETLSNYILADFDKEINKPYKLNADGTAEKILNDIRNNAQEYPPYITIARSSKSKNLHVFFRAEVAPKHKEAYKHYLFYMCAEFVEAVKRRTGASLEIDENLKNIAQGLEIYNNTDGTRPHDSARDYARGQNIALSADVCKTLTATADEERARIAEYVSTSVTPLGTFKRGEEYEHRKGEFYAEAPRIINAVAYLEKDEHKAAQIVQSIFNGVRGKDREIKSFFRTALRVAKNKTHAYFKFGAEWLTEKGWFVPDYKGREAERCLDFCDVMRIETGEYLSDYYTQIKNNSGKYDFLGICAKMGMGKTELIKKIVRTAHEEGKTCLVLNYLNTLNAQYKGIENLEIYEGKGSRESIRRHDFTNYSAVVNVANVSAISAEHLYNLDYIIIDEYHKTYIDTTYRQTHCDNLISMLQAVRDINESATNKTKVFAFTATPIRDDFFCYIKAQKKEIANRDKYDVRWAQGLTSKNWHKFLEAMARTHKGAQFVFMLNNAKDCLERAEQITKKTGIKCDYITSKADTFSKRHLIENETLPKGIKCFFCTSIINEGINIKNKNKIFFITDVYNIKNPLNLVQLGGRNRTTEKILYCGYTRDADFNICIQPSRADLTEAELLRLSELSRFYSVRAWENYIKFCVGTNCVRFSNENLTDERAENLKNINMTIEKTKPNELELLQIVQQFEKFKDKTDIKQAKIFEVDGKCVKYADMSIINKIKRYVGDGYYIHKHISTFAIIYKHYTDMRDYKYFIGCKEVKTGRAVNAYTRAARKNREKYSAVWDLLDRGEKSKKKIEDALCLICEQGTKYQLKINDVLYCFDTKTEAIDKKIYDVIGVSKKMFKNYFKSYINKYAV